MERYSDRAIEIINELHTERLDYESEYLPLIECANRCAAYEDTGLEPDDCMAYSDGLELRMYRSIGSISELRAMKEARDEGLVATWPAEVWAVKPNHRSNEWNDEPEYRLVHYIVHAFEPETGRYFVNTDNYPGLKHRHWIKGKGLYKTRAEAEAAIGGGGDG